jgi:glutamate/tyrosine decarboxylase-like PLP-dependent enzyme
VSEVQSRLHESHDSFFILQAWGGAVALSKKHRHLLDGVDLADSFAWNPHKMMRVPLQSSLLLVRNKHVAMNANVVHVAYLFQQDRSCELS